ncbi:MAG: FKBP-type peptidyl-prolyl cis-trans isomerase [Planctomycetaceae bacterium]
MLRVGLLAALVMGLLSATTARAEVGATPVDRIHHLPGFEVELLYSVPGEQQGSWVSLCVDNKGRLITCDQYGKLFRLTLPERGADGKATGEIKVEPIAVEVGMAQGLLYAFDALYVSVNSNRPEKAGLPGFKSGLYRVSDSDGDDQFDKLETLREFKGSSEHGPHGLLLSPDGQSIYICAGNHTEIPNPETSVVPRVWDEDFLISRMWDARGHAKGRMAPGGWIARTDKDGKSFDLFAIGFRNEYDIAFNSAGELFTYDADMEWDIGTPWYRPTRVNHVTSGSEFGWRSGTGKWPEYYPDSRGSVVDIGNGSPTGIVFGTGAKFPAKYQRALFIADWSYGTVYAVHMTPDGSTYTGEAEKFLTAQPFPVTDMVVHPDGAMYITIGGRETQSGLYRVTYAGEESTAPAETLVDAGAADREVRHQLESLHHVGEPADLATIWPQLSHKDRSIRYAARVALEHQPVDTWRQVAAAEVDTNAAIQAIIALARHGKETDHAAAIESLNRIDWATLDDSQRLDLIRAYSLVFIRLGKGSEASRMLVTKKFDSLFPAKNRKINRELSQLLVYLEAPSIAARTVHALTTAPTQEDQIHFALTLKDLKETWSPEVRTAYFEWFNAAAAQRGGMSFGGFLDNIRKEAIANLPKDEVARLKTILDAKIVPIDPTADYAARPIVKKYTVDELLPILDADLHGRDFENGRKMFGAAACFKCHRVRGEGGSVGPDLTGVGGRFNHKNLLESMVEPSKVISDQYEMTQFVLNDGKQVVGRVINLNGDNMMVMTNMLEPGNITTVKRTEVELMQAATTSMMPDGLIDRLTKDEILDLVAFLKSGGNPDHEAFAVGQVTTKSGLKYRIVREGNGKKPTAKDTVTCHYRGTLTSGQEFDSSYKRKEPTSFPLSGVIAGWTEGLQLIGEGGKIELEIPGDLAYGSRGIPGVIPANATLLFEVELIKVK